MTRVLNAFERLRPRSEGAWKEAPTEADKLTKQQLQAIAEHVLARLKPGHSYTATEAAKRSWSGVVETGMALRHAANQGLVEAITELGYGGKYHTRFRVPTKKGAAGDAQEVQAPAS